MKVLLDTSFLLPSLGIEAGGEVADGLRGLHETETEVYCSRFSILESLWVVARLAKRTAFDLDRFRVGLRSVLESGRYLQVEESTEVFTEAVRLSLVGHEDMIDNLLYASSRLLGLKLLTLDAELKSFIQGHGLEDTLITPHTVRRA